MVQKVSIEVDELDRSSLVESDEVLVVVSSNLKAFPLTVDTSLVEGSSLDADSADSVDVPLADLCQKVDVGPFSAADYGQFSIVGASPIAGVLGVSVDWKKVVGKVEDGWTSLKIKKGNSTIPSFDMALHSQKSRPKCIS